VQRLAAHAQLAAAQARLLVLAAALVDRLLGAQPRLFRAADAGLDRLQLAARAAELRLDLEPLRQQPLELLLARGLRRHSGLQAGAQLDQALAEALVLGGHALQVLQRRLPAAAQRLRAQRELVRLVAVDLGRLPGLLECLAQRVTPRLEGLALPGQPLHRLERAVQRRARFRQGLGAVAVLDLEFLEFAGHAGDPGAQLLESCAAIAAAALQVGQRAVVLLQLLLQFLALALVLAPGIAQFGVAGLGGGDLGRQRGQRLLQLAQLLAARQHARVLVALARHAQPVGSEPEPVAGDHRLVRGEPAAQRQGAVQVVRRVDPGEQAAEGVAAVELAAERLARGRRRAGLAGRRVQEQVPGLEPRGTRRVALQLVDADRL
jgi:hypothetical protein